MAELHTIPAILDDLRAGKMIVLVDDEQRENEGDLVCAAQFVTAEVVNFMLREARGMLCLALAREICDRLELNSQTPVSTALRGTAYTVSVDAQDRFGNALLAAGRDAMAVLQRTEMPGIVIVGRPYNVHDAGVNLSVAYKLRDNYGVNCIPLDFLETATVDVRDVNSAMYWGLGQRVLAAAKIVAQHPNLHIIHITNFKCGPDSFIKHYIRTASGKPFLTLQFDGHSNDAGMMTRCEAYLDSKGLLRPWRKDEARATQPA